MRNLLAVLGVPAAILFSLATLGCGASSTPVGTVTATTHPLVAQYAIQHSHSGLTAWVEFGPDTNYGRKTSVAANSGMTVGQTLTILVAGMKAQTTYHMRAHADWSGGSWVDQDKTLTTGALPSSLPAPTITVTQPDPNATPAPGVELLSLIQPFGTQMLQSVCTDLQGNIIWFYAEGGVPIKPMPNGHFILNLNTDLREIDLAGNTIRDVSATQVNQSLQANGYSFSINDSSFSHDVLTLDNGHWIGLVKITKDFTDLPGYPGTITIQGDGLVDIDPNGNVVWAWSAFDYLDVNRFLQGLPDWTHANSLLYTPDGNLMLSVRNQSWILKIDYANGTGSGNILWKLGNDGDFTINGGDPAQWFYAEHDPVLLSTDGTLSTLAVWDNGNYRINSAGIPCESSPTAPACYSRPVIFQLDEVTKVATVLWQDLPGTYSPWGGSIGTLSNGNVEFDITSPLNARLSQIIETTQTEPPAIVWQMTVTGENAYRASRIPSLYPGVTWQQ